jgi:hypothetical protein
MGQTRAVDRENLSKRPFLDLAQFPTPSLMGLFDLYILRQVDTLLGTTVGNSKRGTAFSVRSVPRFYKQDNY